MTRKVAIVFLALSLSSRLFAGDAVAIGYTKDGVWTHVTFYGSSTPKGGKDYKTGKEASEVVVRDLKRRGGHQVARTSVVSSSDSTGFVAVARGNDESGKTKAVAGRGKSQAEAESSVLELLKAAGVGAEHKIVYRYFSYGADTE